MRVVLVAGVAAAVKGVIAAFASRSSSPVTTDTWNDVADKPAAP